MIDRIKVGSIAFVLGCGLLTTASIAGLVGMNRHHKHEHDMHLQVDPADVDSYDVIMNNSERIKELELRIETLEMIIERHNLGEEREDTLNYPQI